MDCEFVGAFPLPNDAGVIRSLKSYGGHVFIIAEGALLVFDLNDLEVLLGRISLPHERLQDLSVNPPEPDLPVDASTDDIQLLLTSNRGVYSLSLLQLDLKVPPTQLYGTTGARSVYHAALSCGGNVHWLEYDSATQSSELHSLARGQIATYAGRMHPPIKFDAERLIIASAENLSLYDAEGRTISSVTLTHEGEAEPVSMNCRPTFDEKAKVVYLASNQSLWSAAVDNDKLVTHRLQLKFTGDERLAAADDSVFVARSDGFYILDTFGSIKWKADSIFISEDTSDGFPPQVDGKYCVFSGLKGQGNVIRIYTVNNPNRYTNGIAVEMIPACPPLLSAGHLFVAVTDVETRSQEVRVYKLKESL